MSPRVSACILVLFTASLAALRPLDPAPPRQTGPAPGCFRAPGGMLSFGDPLLARGETSWMVLDSTLVTPTLQGSRAARFLDAQGKPLLGEAAWAPHAGDSIRVGTTSGDAGTVYVLAADSAGVRGRRTLTSESRPGWSPIVVTSQVAARRVPCDSVPRPPAPAGTATPAAPAPPSGT